MGYQLLKEDILFYQRFLTAADFYKGKLDGKWLSQTNNADAAFTAKSKAIADQLGRFDERSESNIITLLPKAQIGARNFLQQTKNNKKDVRIISGTRTYAEQDTLYKKGRFGNTLPKVTNAKGGQSNHNFGIAWDIGLFEAGVYITDDKKYIALASSILPSLSNIEWGGNWKTFKDYPHYQIKTSLKNITTIKNLFETGKLKI
jgi:peptidoglycan L-alanyl-D-glutamate endopeptidase CwlK